MSGQGEEDLVQRRLAEGEVVDLDSGRVERSERFHQAVAGAVDADRHAAGGLVDLRLAVGEAPERHRDRSELIAPLGVHLDHVPSDATLELGRRAVGDRPAVIDDHDLAGQLVGLVEVLGREQHVRARVDEGPDRVPELDAAPRIEAGRRLVEEQQPRLTDQARPEVEPPAHAARVGAHEPIGSLDESELFEHALRARPR